jgi:RNA ligase
VALHVNEIVDPEHLQEMIAGGWVKATAHPRAPLTIYNYTAQTQYAREWNQTTRACRGLIVNEHGHVRARPWPKFFNYGEHPEGALCLHEPASVTDKMDGSLGILYEHGRQLSIATRGSFTSDQAMCATWMLRNAYPHFWPSAEVTYLFEIIHPAHRVVLDYEDTFDLFLLGGVLTETGQTIHPDEIEWPGP